MKRIFLFILALNFALAPTLLPSMSSVEIDEHPDVPVDNGQIAFSAGFYEGPKDIYTIDLRNQSISQLTFSGNNHHPSWSPDGCRIAFHSYDVSPDGIVSTDVYVMNADGSHKIRFTYDGGVRPVWSPDGTKIAYVRMFEGNGAIYIASADGSETIQLTSHTADNGTRGLAWSPDGRWLAFISNRENPLYDVYVVDVDEALEQENDEAFTNLTNSSGVCPGDYRNLSWSPTGDRLAFSSACESTKMDIYIMTLQETKNGLEKLDEKNVTQSEWTDGLDGLDWSPDGSKLVFVRLLDYRPTTDVYIVDVDNTIYEGEEIVGFKLLDGAETGYIYSFPAWAPQRCNIR
jgi:Tol biopolymer transport system component